MNKKLTAAEHHIPNYEVGDILYISPHQKYSVILKVYTADDYHPVDRGWLAQYDVYDITWNYLDHYSAKSVDHSEHIQKVA